MEKIYAVVDSNNFVINTILLDLEISAWVPPEGCRLIDAITPEEERNAAIGDLIIDSKFETVLSEEPQIDPTEKLKQFLLDNPDVAEMIK